ncbi:bifunctional Winged helix DNA-binding domain superfamily/DDRGK domain containing protein/Winged helix-like DNA-binding domain superfamily [Babesia duncani]|uniref:Bifunctional Winged helix DNA-binding domain superfamily/DDRGK domain containing protein/Winged helix-like DNA-binding domain superfamily n=1 Tax=Babesia duncani TaxID=323732 RepID=A0AAD9UNV8_9APIC|nr:bifunctional Winged helix DNA-binding domain superfamily/DDRGK domain containing protein/Winged helix-like DNA-binding domain superfamily [Babesia duncani]
MTLHNIFAFDMFAPEASEPVAEPIGESAEQQKKPKTVKQLKRQEQKEERRRLKQMQDEEKSEKEKRMQTIKELQEQRRMERYLAKKQEEDKKREQEENAYKEIAAGFVIEQQGELASETKTLDTLDFVNYIIWKKLSEIEEIAGRFSLTPTEVVNRINDLESQGRIFGKLRHVTNIHARYIKRAWTLFIHYG